MRGILDETMFLSPSVRGIFLFESHETEFFEEEAFEFHG